MNVINNLPSYLKTILANSEPSEWNGKLKASFNKPKKLAKAQMTLLQSIIKNSNWKNNPKMYNVASHLMKRAYRTTNSSVKKSIADERAAVRKVFKQFEVKKMDKKYNDEKKKGHFLNGDKKKKVLYHGKKERAHTWVYFHGNGKAKAHRGTYLYTVDRYGQFHTIREEISNNIHIKHSTLFAGRSIAGAGEITFSDKGKVRKINNSSGHYKPGEKEMKNTLTALKRHGVNLAKVDVTVSGKNSKGSDWNLIA